MTNEERELSITYLEGIKEEYIESEGYERHPLAEYYAIENAIKALEQTKWIPVSEKLPEDRKTVLVTAYWHETYQVMQASYFGDGVWWCVPFNNTGKHEQKLKPKAWMPLPQPYSEVEE